MIDELKCAECKFYKRDSEYDGLGDCIHEGVRGERARIIIKYCEEFYISEDFGCIFAESIPVVKQEGTKKG